MVRLAICDVGQDVVVGEEDAGRDQEAGAGRAIARCEFDHSAAQAVAGSQEGEGEQVVVVENQFRSGRVGAAVASLQFEPGIGRAGVVAAVPHQGAVAIGLGDPARRKSRGTGR